MKVTSGLEHVDYTHLTLAQVRDAFDAVIRDAQATFGALDARQLNWRSDEGRWSVAQCFDHLLAANRLMLASARDALASGPTSVWQRLPVLPGLLGRLLIRSQSPGATRKYRASPGARPTASDIPADVLERFIRQQREAMDWLKGLDERRAGRTIMTSPFARAITYSVLDGCRLMAAHDRRHFEQARRVVGSAGFPDHARDGTPVSGSREMSPRA